VGRHPPVRYLLVLNPTAGDDDEARQTLDAVRSRFDDVKTVRLDGGVELRSEIERGLEEDRVVVAAGGDGTINSVAQHVVGRGVLGVLPGGTLNHFCRDLGVRDLDGALDVLEAGEVRAVDVGKVGDRYFLNNAGMGLYPEVVYERERHEHRIGKWRAAATASLRVMRRARPLIGTIEADGDARALIAWALFFGNNRFGTATGRIGTRERLDEGILDVRLLTLGRRRARRSRLAWRVLRGRPWSTSRLVRREAKHVSLRLTGGPRLVSYDGEAGATADSLQVEIEPVALRVVAPPVDTPEDRRR
jgi:diacylglycerol kinase family enzyme